MEQIPINSLSPGFSPFIVIVVFINSPCPPPKKNGEGGGLNQACQLPPDLAYNHIYTM